MFGNVSTKQSYQNEFEIKQTASLQFFSVIMMTCTYSHRMCVTRTNESFNDIIKKNKMKALENKYIHIKYMYKVIQFVKLNAKFISYFFLYMFISNEKELIEIRNYLTERMASI